MVGQNKPMGTASELKLVKTINVTHPKPLSSLTAAARRITGTQVRRLTAQVGREWQDECWNMYDLVGELHYLSTTLAGRMAQARLFVGQLSPDDTQAPQQVTDGPAAQAFDALSTANGRQQMIQRMGASLFLAGEGWLVGIPRYLIEEDSGRMGNGRLVQQPEQAQGIAAILPPEPEPALEDLEWFALSVSEVTTVQGDNVRLHCGYGVDGTITVHPDQVYMIRVWRPHPRVFIEADSPSRASLPVLRELTGLTMHVGAQVDSRLAGAGVLLVPASAAVAVRQAGHIENPDEDSDPFTDALMESMIAPIRDRASASAIVPLVVTVPDESIAGFKHLTFDTALDTAALSLREEAIRRLALGLDAPPEVLLGTAAQNHWGAWLVREDVVSTHLEPGLALICDALTTQYLQPVLVGQGMTPEQARTYVIWYDVSHLVSRPNRFADAQVLYKEGVISESAFRQAGGFSDEDAPPKLASNSADLALQMMLSSPRLASLPGGVLQLATQLAHLAIATEEQLQVATVLAPPEPGAAQGTPTPTDADPLHPAPNTPPGGQPAAPKPPAGNGGPPAAMPTAPAKAPGAP